MAFSLLWRLKTVALAQPAAAEKKELLPDVEVEIVETVIAFPGAADLALESKAVEPGPFASPTFPSFLFL